MFQEPTYDQRAKPLHAYLCVFGVRQTTWLAVIVFVGMSMILAGRMLYTAPDDESYIAYFEGKNSILLTNTGPYLLEEPLWLAYASSMGSIVGTETALRITIFLGSFLFLAASGKLARGAWIFIFLAFITDVTLATQMYYNQIRQGFALSVFLVMMAGGLHPFFGAVVASAIHASFLAVIPCIIAAAVIRRSKMRLAAILFAVGLSVFYLNRLMGDIDLGRRSVIYAFEGNLNVFFYALAISQYGLIFFLLKQKHPDDQQEFWFCFSLIFVTLAIGLSLIHEAGGRLMYIANALMAILIGLNLRRTQAKIGAVVWLLLLLMVLLNEGRKDNFGPDSWLGRWVLILT